MPLSYDALALLPVQETIAKIKMAGQAADERQRAKFSGAYFVL